MRTNPSRNFKKRFEGGEGGGGRKGSWVQFRFAPKWLVNGYLWRSEENQGLISGDQ